MNFAIRVLSARGWSFCSDLSVLKFVMTRWRDTLHIDTAAHTPLRSHDTELVISFIKMKFHDSLCHITGYSVWRTGWMGAFSAHTVSNVKFCLSTGIKLCLRKINSIVNSQNLQSEVIRLWNVMIYSENTNKWPLLLRYMLFIYHEMS